MQLGLLRYLKFFFKKNIYKEFHHLSLIFL